MPRIAGLLEAFETDDNLQHCCAVVYQTCGETQNITQDIALARRFVPIPKELQAVCDWRSRSWLQRSHRSCKDAIKTIA